MAIVRKKFDPANPVGLTPEQRAYHDALTEEQIQAAAEADEDNPPMTEEELASMKPANPVRRAREATGLSQSEFARTYQIGLGRLQDLEQERTKPDSVVVAYMSIIERVPGLVLDVLEGKKLSPARKVTDAANRPKRKRPA
jgi:putative transcriptional regulator